MDRGERRTLSQVVADDIVGRIRAGEIGVGDRLPTLQELMERHDVGYGVAREAMQQLVALGIADVRPRRGAIVRQLDAGQMLDNATLAALLSDQGVEDLYALRRLIEVAIAGQAAQRATERELVAIRRAQAAFDEALASGVAVHAADVELHRVIAEASGNLVYVRVLDALRDVLAAVREQASVVPGASRQASAEHAPIIAAIEAGDEEAARDAMRRHIDTATETVMQARRLPAGAAEHDR